jgi:hypothetical protein
MNENRVYDIIIVGAGPSGLTLGQIAGNYNKKVLILESESEIGGCHSVKRLDGLFTEHSPRIYSSNYNNFKTILKDMGTSFENLFVPSKMSTFSYIWSFLKQFTIMDILRLMYAYCIFMFDSEYGNTMSVSDYIVNFSDKAKYEINQICKGTEGVDSTRYTLNEFLHIINFGYFVNPRFPNDTGLFAIWKEKLDKINVETKLNTRVKNIIDKDDTVIVNTSNGIFYGKKCVFAIPPINLLNIVQNSSYFGLDTRSFSTMDFFDFATGTKYDDYISCTFHWNKKIDFPVMRQIATDTLWGIEYNILSDSMDMNDPRSITCISACVTELNVIGSNGKLPKDCSNDEFMIQVFTQLNSRFTQETGIEYNKPDIMVFSPYCRLHDVLSSDSSPINFHSAFAKTKGFSYMKPQINENIYSIGPHNGNKDFGFTSLESAVSNAFDIAHELIPESREKFCKYSSVFTIKNMFFLVLFIIFLWTIKQIT